MVLNADLLKHLFNSSDPDEIGEDRINNLIEQYPYFVHPHWISVIKKWNSSHNQDDLRSAGVYTFNPFRLKQYCTETPSQILSPPTQPFYGTKTPIVETSSQNESNLAENNIAQIEQTEVPSELPQAAEDKVEEKPGKEKQETHPEPLLQPLFTQDYFAFTGAKLPEQIENDKKPTMDQLRSFTGWLRTMKRSAAYSTDPDLTGGNVIPDPSRDKYSEQEVVTETMAEVRASKGHYDKAIAIYEKLSLSNPEKSVYFAQKIKALKNK